MLISFVRTFILLLCVIAAVRLMGKRQIGQLQPSELVITILLSQIAATPMQDNDLPLLNTVVAILVLTGVEIVLSVIGMKSPKARAFLEGNPVIIVNDGKLDVKQLQRLRYTMDDVAEALRQKDIFDISQVQYAVAETNGALSVMLKPEYCPLTAEDAGKTPEDKGMPVPVVCDGKILDAGLRLLGLKEKAIREKAEENKLRVEDIFYMTIDKTGCENVVKKEDEG